MMIDEKWLNLYRHIATKVTLPLDEQQLVPKLEERVTLLSEQFAEDEAMTSEKMDWLEHEAFVFVFGAMLRELTIDGEQLEFLFDVLLSVNLAQLGASLINNNKTLLSVADFKLKSAIINQEIGDYQQAQGLLFESIAEDGSNPMSHCRLGFNYIYLGQNEAAEDAFKQAIEVAPDFVGGYQNLAGLYYQQAEFAKAFEFAQQAQAIDNTLVTAYITAISALLADRKFELADEWVDKAIQHDARSIELVRLAGIAAHQNGRLEEALEALEHYLSVNPHNVDVFSIRLRIKTELGQYADIEDDLQLLYQNEPSDPWLTEQLFLCYYHNQKWSQAQQMMVELNKLGPQYKIAHKKLIDEINKATSLDVENI